MLSERFLFAVFQKRVQGVAMYRLAIEAGLTPSMFSAILHGARPIQVGDTRIVKIGGLLGLKPEECFASDRAVAS